LLRVILPNVLMLTVIMNSQDKFPLWMNSNPGKRIIRQIQKVQWNH
jgi:hypothetical protein